MTAVPCAPTSGSKLAVDLHGYEEPRDGVVGGDRRGELNDLAVVEMTANHGEGGVGNLDVESHDFRVPKDRSSEFAEVGDVAPSLDVVDLVVGQSRSKEWNSKFGHRLTKNAAQSPQQTCIRARRRRAKLEPLSRFVRIPIDYRT